MDTSSGSSGLNEHSLTCLKDRTPTLSPPCFVGSLSESPPGSHDTSGKLPCRMSLPGVHPAHAQGDRVLVLLQLVTASALTGTTLICCTL